MVKLPKLFVARSQVHESSEVPPAEPSNTISSPAIGAVSRSQLASVLANAPASSPSQTQVRAWASELTPMAITMVASRSSPMPMYNFVMNLMRSHPPLPVIGDPMYGSPKRRANKQVAAKSPMRAPNGSSAPYLEQGDRGQEQRPKRRTKQEMLQFAPHDVA